MSGKDLERPAPGSRLSARARLRQAEEAYARHVHEPAGHAAEREPHLRPEPLERLLEISRAMNRIHDRDKLLSYVGDGLRELFDAENSFLVLFGEDGEPRVHSAHQGGAPDAPPSLSATILDQVRRTRQPVWIDDVTDRPDLSSRASIERFKIASVLCAPLRIGEEVIGALQFDHRGSPRPFPPSDMRLLMLFADHVATALNNIQLIGWLNQALAEVQAAQRRAVQLERLSVLGEMATGIAHDFNNTLFVALGFCDVLLSNASLEPSVRSAVDRIRTCALDAASTVRRLQHFATGRGSDESAATLDPNAVVEEMPEFTRHKWGPAGEERPPISMRVELGATAAVRAHPGELREVLTNLIFNAVDAMEGRGGEIRLATGVEGDRVWVDVTDQGAGIPAALVPEIFRPFFTTKGQRGSGFGLATCFSIATRLGGEIAVESREGEGSRFRLWLPAAPEEAVPAREPADARRPHDVLVLDDDGEVLETVLLLLEALGHRAQGESDPGRALERLGRGRFDLLLMDFAMPGWSGADVVARVRSLDPEVPILILTGWGDQIALDPDTEAAVVGVLGKPVSLEGLRAAIARAIPRPAAPGHARRAGH